MKIVSDSHLDHGLSQAVIDYIRETFADKAEFFIETITLPMHLGTVPCNLHGPASGGMPVPESEVWYEKRGSRPWFSRMCNRSPVQVRLVTVVAGPHDNEPCVLYTAYGGSLAPKEIDDPSLSQKEKVTASLFWQQHALGQL